MRKIIAGASVFLLLFPMLALSGCKKKKQDCSYFIRAEYKEGSLKGEMDATIPNNTDNALTEIPFFLYANSFSEGAKEKPVSELYAPHVYYEGMSYGGITIKEVSGGKSWRTSEDGNWLFVTLNEPLYPDERIKLSVSYDLILPKADFRFGIGENTVNLSCFYPQLPAETKSGFYSYAPATQGDPFVLDAAFFEVELTVPKELAAACAGEAEERIEGAEKIYRVRAEGVREMAFVLGRFEKRSLERGGVAIDYYYFADGFSDKTLCAAADALESYSELFGAYPYSRYVLAETDLVMGGMEYSGFAMISAALSQKEKAEAVAHETSHMWWHALIGSDEACCAWQDEGLAEYSVALFYESNPSYGEGYRERVNASERAYRNYCSVKSGSTVMTRPLSDYASDYEYRVLAYDKGVILFDRLRETLGDKKFFASLQSYVKKYRGKVACEEDLIACFSPQEELILSFTEGRCVI